jgi:hypothetical protein
VVEPRDDHGDGGDQKMIKCFIYRKEEKKQKQNTIEIKAKVLLGFLVLVIKTP